MSEIKLLPCPICKKEVTVHGGDIDWHPTFYDPDSGGDPYEIQCECGLVFCIGYCDMSELANAWNTRKPMQDIVERLEAEKDALKLLAPSWLSREKQIEQYKGRCDGIDDAIKIVKEVGGIDG